jgi:hypothetical protein
MCDFEALLFQKMRFRLYGKRSDYDSIYLKDN